MNANELKEKLTKEDIIEIVTRGLGSNGYELDSSGNPIFQTICHNQSGEGKYKLYYYVESRIFHCFTECSASFDIFELVQKAKKANNFVQAFEYVSNFFGFSRFDFELDDSPPLTEDWSLLEKYSLLEHDIKKEETHEEVIFSKNILNFYSPLLPDIWYQEGISLEAMRKYGIRISASEEKIIIPHFDKEGNLVGIRARSYNLNDLDEGRKYSPVCIEKKWYNHMLGEHLYGLNFNKHIIGKVRKAVIVEGEKSVLKAETFYPENNFVVACCGSSISEKQVNLLLELGVNEIVIAFDKENDEFVGSEKSVSYLEKLKNIAHNFTPYVNVYLVYDTENLLDYKDSPFDKGKEVLEKLMRNKILVPSISLDSEIKRKKGGKK